MKVFVHQDQILSWPLSTAVSPRLYCTTLHRTVLYCTACTVLYCTVLYCTVLYCTVLYCTALYCTVLHCLHYITEAATRRAPASLSHLAEAAMELPESVRTATLSCYTVDWRRRRRRRRRRQEGDTVQTHVRLEDHAGDQPFWEEHVSSDGFFYPSPSQYVSNLSKWPSILAWLTFFKRVVIPLSTVGLALKMCSCFQWLSFMDYKVNDSFNGCKKYQTIECRGGVTRKKNWVFVQISEPPPSLPLFDMFFLKQLIQTIQTIQTIWKIDLKVVFIQSHDGRGMGRCV